MTDERRHGVEEILERLAAMEARQDAQGQVLQRHIIQEDADRREDIEERKEMRRLLGCIKDQLSEVKSELSRYKGAVGLIVWIAGFLVAGAGLVVAWFKT